MSAIFMASISRGPKTIREIMDDTEMSQSRVYRIRKELLKSGFIEQDSEGIISLTVKGRERLSLRLI